MARVFNTVIEPFRIKVVEPIPVTTESERARLLAEAHYNLFALRADKVTIDLLTDSGTGAMSAEQWASLFRGDESYAGATSFFRLQEVVQRLTGYRHVLPVHQGRAAEKLLMAVFGGPGKIIPSNSHFDTTEAHIEFTGATALNLPCTEVQDSTSDAPFKGNIDLNRLEDVLAREAANIPFVAMTVTNNSVGGQPVSMRNLQEVRRLCNRFGKPLLLDAARFAENAYLIKLREPGFGHRTVRSIAEEMFALADGCWISAKKDGMVNIGGVLAFNIQAWLAPLRDLAILNEGFTTYGGMAGRDLEALARGFVEVTEETYLEYRLRSVAYVGEGFLRAGLPVVRPFGGHAVYVDAKKLLPHIPPHELPGQALAAAFYLVGGIRAVEIGSLMFGKRDDAGNFIAANKELVRFAIPRRVYTQSHMDYCIEAAAMIAEDRLRLRGFRVIHEAPQLRHFTAQLAPVGGALPHRIERPAVTQQPAPSRKQDITLVDAVEKVASRRFPTTIPPL